MRLEDSFDSLRAIRFLSITLFSQVVAKFILLCGMVHPNSGPRMAQNNSGLPGWGFGPRTMRVRGRDGAKPFAPNNSVAMGLTFMQSTMSVSRDDLDKNPWKMLSAE